MDNKHEQNKDIVVDPNYDGWRWHLFYDILKI